MFGAYSVDHGTLSFRPRYPLASGVTYHAVFHPPSASASEAVFHGPEPPSAPPTQVIATHPSLRLVGNQLKLYVAFSAPMQGGDIFPLIHLLEQDGKPAYLPFVGQDLWNRDFTRLTLLFDPGRIKRGVKPNVDMGPVLVEGRRYTLIIDREFKDASGRPLAEAFRREFTVEPDERRSLDPKLWKLTEPRAGTTEPLIVKFDRPLDYGLLGDVFQIPGIPGKSTIGAGETDWSFQPDKPWPAGEHTLVIDMALEDLAGNRIGRPFDVDTMTSPAPRISNPTTSLTFRAR